MAQNPGTNRGACLALIAVIFLAAACGLGRRGSTRVETFPGTNMASYQTYRWWQSPLEYGRGHTEDEADLDRKIRYAVDRQLLNRGYAEAANRPPDFLVQYNVTPYEETSAAFREYLSRRADSGDKARHPEGTLVIEVVDAASRRVVWRATAGHAIEPGLGTNLVEPAVWETTGDFPARPSQ